MHLTRKLTLDAVGFPLHKRGYRVHISDAPIRETLAAACAQAILQDAPLMSESVSIWDPFCGSGTLLHEMAIGEILNETL